LSASLNTTAIFSIFIDLEHQSYQFKNYADGVLANELSKNDALTVISCEMTVKDQNKNENHKFIL
jgi:hypothetical protein